MTIDYSDTDVPLAIEWLEQFLSLDEIHKAAACSPERFTAIASQIEWSLGLIRGQEEILTRYCREEIRKLACSS